MKFRRKIDYTGSMEIKRMRFEDGVTKVLQRATSETLEKLTMNFVSLDVDSKFNLFSYEDDWYDRFLGIVETAEGYTREVYLHNNGGIISKEFGSKWRIITIRDKRE